MDRISYGEAHFYQEKLIRCQSYHGNYVCSGGGDAMSRGDGMDSSSRVPLVRSVWHLWPCPIVTGIKYHRFLKTWLKRLYPALESPPGVTIGGPGTY
jgi:hypothetical protein